MTEEQFKQFLSLQVNQLHVLSGILSCLQQLSASAGKPGLPWSFQQIQEMLDNAAKSVKVPPAQ